MLLDGHCTWQIETQRMNLLVKHLAEYAWFGLLVGHALTSGGIVGVLAMFMETRKGGHEAGTLHQKQMVSSALVLELKARDAGER